MNWQSGQDFTPPPGWQHVEFGGDMGGFSDFFQTLFGGGGMGKNFGNFSDIFSGQHQPMRRDVEADLTLTLEDIMKGGTYSITINKKAMNVRLPKGITDGTQIKLPGKSDGGGDIYVNIHIAPHKIFEVSGNDLTRDVKVSVCDAVLGKDIHVETLNGSVTVKMPPGIQDGQKLRLRGKGIPKRDGTNGDMFVRVRVEIPRHITPKQKELWEELSKLS